MWDLIQFVYTDFINRWEWSLLIIPGSAAVIGWGTNVLALKMTFYPVNFIGIGVKGLKPIGWAGIPAIGWQGIIPSKAGIMAGKAVDMITSKLIDVEEQFAKINPKVVAKEMEAVMLPLCRRIIDETMTQELPLWKMLSDKRKEAIYERAAKEIPLVTEEIIQEIKDNIAEIFLLKEMAIKYLTENKSLLNEIFLRVGEKEFKFIEYSGFYFGGIFGVVQMLLWMYYQAWWQLPLGGLVVGYYTNVLALRMIFWPTNPIRFLGLKIQGLFIQRQKEVSKEYAKIVASNVMTMPNIFEAMFKGPASDRLVTIIERHVSEGVDNTAGFSSTLIKFTSGTKTYDNIKRIAAQRFVEVIPQHIHYIFDYAEQALAIEYTLRKKMSELPPDDFANFLRPVFQEDEWKLIVVGAILGLLAGLIQIPFV
jgi:uncharacterized membrane protein YheB (UPF0754 family)